MKAWKLAGIFAAILIALAGVSLALAPVVYAELARLVDSLPAWPPSSISEAPLAGSSSATIVDGYWWVQRIATDTYAIGEPQNQLDNFEYLLVGKSRALLIDAGATGRDIHPALATLTNLPVTVIPTHLHYDHTNGLRNFTSIALIDLPETRSRVREGVVYLGRYQYLGAAGQDPPRFRVTEWVRPDAYIDLGERRVQVLWTPGHTTSSISVHDPAAKLLFTGDLIYTTTLYAFVPGSSLSAYVTTADRLLAMLPGDTVIYGAHCCRNDAPPGAPWLDMDDLRDVRRAVENIRTGNATGRGFIIRRFPVNSRMTIVTLYPVANR
jgi:glyoxylase-like metal-dependent hydrolase (beta-lactamase superfamily II)